MILYDDPILGISYDNLTIHYNDIHHEVAGNYFDQPEMAERLFSSNSERWKFKRGKRLDDGGWFSGTVMTFKGITTIYEETKKYHEPDYNWDEYRPPEQHAVDPETICFSTYKKDKHQTLMFEQDVIEFDLSDAPAAIGIYLGMRGRGVIQYHSKERKSFVSGVFADGEPFYDLSLDHFGNNIRVIGNIIDHRDVFQNIIDRVHSKPLCFKKQIKGENYI
jgi:hypothetical protein